MKKGDGKDIPEIEMEGVLSCSITTGTRRRLSQHHTGEDAISNHSGDVLFTSTCDLADKQRVPGLSRYVEIFENMRTGINKRGVPLQSLRG